MCHVVTHARAMQNAAPQLVRVDGVDVHWAEMGEGRPLVLLHGLTDSHRTWGKVAPALARHHRVLMPDLAGHGLSGRPDASYSVEWHAQLVTAWLDSLGIDEMDLVGHSFGGGVAQWMLIEQRARVRRLALVAPGGLGPDVSFAIRLGAIPNVVERFGQPLLGPFTRLGIRAAGASYDHEDVDALAWMNSKPGTARALGRTLRGAVGWSGQRHHILDAVERVADLPPLTVYWGDRDRVLPGRRVAETIAHLDGARLLRVSGCGHFPHREQPEVFLRDLEAFIDDSPRVAVHYRAPVALSVPSPRVGFRATLLGRALSRVGRIFARRPAPPSRLRDRVAAA